MSRERFEPMYASRPPWDIGRPQPALVEAVEAGEVRGDVLDAGCGTGELALWLASRGHHVLGIDIVPAALEQARAKAAERGLDAHAEFALADALDLATLGRAFDTVLDCGLFHTFDDAERARYVDALGHVIQPGGVAIVLCFSDAEPLGDGPRRVSEDEIRAAFDDADWRVVSVTPARFVVTDEHAHRFSPGGPHALRAIIERTGELAVGG
jgi:SAM-dependent methyltransferase